VCINGFLTLFVLTYTYPLTQDNWISAVKFSPDGSTVAVGTHGITIVLCDVKDGYQGKHMLTTHNAAPTHLGRLHCVCNVV
jgi:WD40 repeat protein